MLKRVAWVIVLVAPWCFLPATVAAPGEELAVADRAAPPPTSDSPEDILRRARNKHFDNTGAWPITEDTYGGTLYASLRPSHVPELPIKTSTTIILAEVQRAAAFIAQDERQVYSEYALRVRRVIKDLTPSARIATLAPGDTIDALRQGGAVRLLSGRVVQFRVSGFDQPQIGQSYVFFLMRAPAIAAFDIRTAYLVKDATVQALDPGGLYPLVTDKPLEMFLQEIEAELSPTGQP